MGLHREESGHVHKPKNHCRNIIQTSWHTLMKEHTGTHTHKGAQNTPRIFMQIFTQNWFKFDLLLFIT